MKLTRFLCMALTTLFFLASFSCPLIPEVLAGGVMSTTIPNNDRRPSDENTPPDREQIAIPSNFPPITEHSGNIPVGVQKRIDSWPTYDTYTPSGLFRKKGAFIMHSNGRTYIYMCFILTDLSHDMQVNYTIEDNTISFYARPIAITTRPKGAALHNITKLISVEDPSRQLSKCKLHTLTHY